MMPSVGAEAGGGDGEPGGRDSKRRGFVVVVVIVKKKKKREREWGIYLSMALFWESNPKYVKQKFV